MTPEKGTLYYNLSFGHYVFETLHLLHLGSGCMVLTQL